MDRSVLAESDSLISAEAEVTPAPDVAEDRSDGS